MLYQAVCIVISFAKPDQVPRSADEQTVRGADFRARNEANVIGNLIDCLHSQTYPSELIDIWLVADNCTDNTAEVARNMGCHVIERFNKEQVGKGYALTYLLDQMNESGASDLYDAFFVFDADNKLDKHYIEEMNSGLPSRFQNPHQLLQFREPVRQLGVVRPARVHPRPRFVSASSRMWLSATAATWAAPASCSPARSCVATTAGNSTYYRGSELPWTACCTATASATAAPPSCTTSSRSPSRSWRQRPRWSKGFPQVSGLLRTGVDQARGQGT